MPTIVIPAFALFFYMIMFVTLIDVRKNRTVGIFMSMLLCFILWTGGSYLMRSMMWPGVQFWCNISIGGMFAIPCLYYVFISDFVGYKGYAKKSIFFFITILILILNFSNGLFESIEVQYLSLGNPEFIFVGRWTLVIPVILVFWVAGAIFKLIYVSIKNKERNIKDYAPIIVGVASLTLGTTLSSIPAIGKFPIDTLSGIVNAYCLFYILYKRRLFNFTFAITRGTTYVLTTIFVLIIGINFVDPAEKLIVQLYPQLSEYTTLIIVGLLALITVIVFRTCRSSMDALFSRKEKQQTNSLKEYSSQITKTISLVDIANLLIQVVQENTESEKVYLFLSNDEEGNFDCLYSTNILDNKHILIDKDSPIIRWLQVKKNSVLIKDFKHSVWYKSLWEQEKIQIDKFGIECLVPVYSSDELIGIVALGGNQSSVQYSQDTLMFLDFVASISAVAIKNAHLYELIYQKASLDHLTGILNREFFFSKMEEVFELNKEDCISLILFNLDDFSLYNELYGRLEGDATLRGVADILKSICKKGAICSRYSAKEFALLLPNADLKTAKEKAKLISNQISKGFDSTKDQWEKTLTVSVGICTYPTASGNIKELIDHAEMAVFKAKQNGKNQIVTYTSDTEDAENKEPRVRGQVYAQYASTVYALTAAIDVKDSYTCNHSANVSEYAVKLAKEKGLSEEHIELIKEAGLLHDIGKIGIPEDILNKVSSLTDDEYEVMKKHVENSISIIRHLPSLKYVIPAVLGHHERWDGKGYPRRIKKEEIPIAARCLCIADSYDAMTTKRSYRDPLPKEVALMEIEKGAGTQFDPELAKLFVNIMRS